MIPKIFIPILLFVAVYISHSRSSVINSIDSMWVIHSAHSIVNQGNLNLNEFRKEVRLKDKYGVRKRNNNIYNYFPYGTPLLAAPFIYFFDLAPDLFVKLVPLTEEAKDKLNKPGQQISSLAIRLSFERAIASAFTALATVIIFLIACNFLTTARAVLLSLIFAFTTPAWSVLSRGLWQHGPSVLMHSISLLCIVMAERNKKYILYSAPFLVFSFFVRPTNAVAIIAYSLFILYYYREYFIKHSLLMLIISAPFVYINIEVFGKIVPQYFNPGRLAPEFNAIMPVLANLISPSRGLLFLSPVFLFSFLAFLKNYKMAEDTDFKKCAYLSVTVIIFHLIVVSVFPNWWGGHCFGARYMSDTISYFIFLLIPFIPQLFKPGKNLLSIAFIIACIFSVWVHYRGANAQIVYMWNVYPENIDNNPARSWDLNDIQLLRGL